jgi:tRNA A-37 threonylcarbamoyl transferase component Bud32
MDLGEPIARGNTAEIYFYGNRIIKLFDERLPDTVAAYEAKKQQAAFECGLCVPQVFDVTRINGRQAIVMEYIKGSTLGEIIRRDIGQTESCLALSAAVQFEMHSKTIAGAERLTDKLRYKIMSAKALDAECRDVLLERLTRMPPGDRLCHGDFHIFNVINSDGRIYIIDWVDSGIGNPCADVCRSYLLYSQFSTVLAEAYLRLYCGKYGMTHDEIFDWAPVIAGSRLSENVTPGHRARLIKIVRQFL